VRRHSLLETSPAPKCGQPLQTQDPNTTTRSTLLAKKKKFVSRQRRPLNINKQIRTQYTCQQQLFSTHHHSGDGVQMHGLLHVHKTGDLRVCVYGVCVGVAVVVIVAVVSRSSRRGAAAVGAGVGGESSLNISSSWRTTSSDGGGRAATRSRNRQIYSAYACSAVVGAGSL
jgi:hypothetical protein